MGIAARMRFLSTLFTPTRSVTADSLSRIQADSGGPIVAVDPESVADTAWRDRQVAQLSAFWHHSG